MNIGWIGMGQIGLPMVLALLKNEHKVIAHTRRPKDHRIITERGGKLVQTTAEILNNTGTLGISVFSEEQLDEIMNGENGIIDKIPAATVVFFHSTISPAFIKKLAAQRNDVHWLDCAFSGGPQEVENGSLTLMVGGNEEILNDLKPVLSSYCNNIHYIGDTGSGLTLKILNNSLFAANFQLALDAFEIAQDSGIDANLAGLVLSQSSGASFALNVLNRGEDPFKTAVMLSRYLDKDVIVARGAAKSSNIDLKRIGQMTSSYGS